jgi:hypothetical protein
MMMFSELRQNATTALEKAKLAFQEQKTSSSLSSHPQNNDEAIERAEEQRHLPTATIGTEDNDVNDMNGTTTTSNRSSMNQAWQDFRSNSTKAFEQAKVFALTRNPSSISAAENDDSDSNDQLNTSINGTTTMPPATDSASQSASSIDRLEELSQYCPKLTIQQRLMGFAMSFTLGCKYFILLVRSRRVLDVRIVSFYYIG